MLLLLDLDDTIFETKSIDVKTFTPAFNFLRAQLITSFQSYEIKNIIEELWIEPFDIVANKYSLKRSLGKEFYDVINQLEYEFDVSPFSAYSSLKLLPFEKMLITTGFRSLQQAKIRALKIESDFSDIRIDDPYDAPRKTKRIHFEEIIKTSRLRQNDIWVIGDNIKSEIYHGSQLGLRTIWINKTGEENGNSDADFTVKNLNEVYSILAHESEKF